MTTEPTQVDARLLERARELAAARHCSVDELLQQALDRIECPTPGAKSVLGLFADEPDLADKLMEDVYRTRELANLRQPADG